MPVSKENLQKLRDIHDKIKSHPFRNAMETRYCYSYKNALYDMSEVWSDIIYHSKFDSPEEELKYYRFGEWIHNYRARLQLYYPHDFPVVFMDYYEQMLQVTHEYLDTGYMDRFYVLDDCRNSKGERVWVVEKYEWITEESIGIKSEILPRYMPVKWKLVENDDELFNCINSGYNKVHESQEQIQSWFEFWKSETKPIIQKLNEKNSDIYRHPVYKAAIYTKSKR